MGINEFENNRNSTWMENVLIFLWQKAHNAHFQLASSISG